MVNVSVLMPVYNAEKYLEEAIESILDQTFTNFEFIIVNDGSKDKSLEIINSYKDSRIVLIDQPNSGLPKALNSGIRHSKSDIIARMDADDIALKDRLEIQYGFLQSHQDYIIVGSNAQVIDVSGNFIYTSSMPVENNACKKMLPATPFFHPSVMFRKEFYLKAGGYNEHTIYLEDVVLFNRMAEYGKYYNIEKPLIRYRIVPNSNSIRGNKQDMIASRIIDDVIKTNVVSAEDYTYLKSQIEKRDARKSMQVYYLLLAKKYLWNNFNPKLARFNLLKAISIKTLHIIILLYGLSFLPSKIVQKIYRSIKNYKQPVEE